MAKADSEILPPTRGIIFVDASTLWRMSGILPKGFCTEEGKYRDVHLTDILLYLARHGYEIVIPEMVSYEAGRYLRDGQTTRDYFAPDEPSWAEQHGFVVRSAQDEKPHAPRSTVDLCEIMRYFLPMIPGYRAAGANIRIQEACPEDTSVQAQFMRDVWKAHRIKDADDFDATHRKRTLLADINPRWKKLDNWGEKSAFALIKAQKNPKVPLFFLSDDWEARALVKDIRSDVPINLLDCHGLYEGVKEQGLLGEIGLKPLNFKDIYWRFAHLFSSTPLEKGWKLPEKVDRSCENGYANESALPPFVQSLDGLTPSVPQFSVVEAEYQGSDKATPSPMDKFRLRQQKMQSLRGGINAGGSASRGPGS